MESFITETGNFFGVNQLAANFGCNHPCISSRKETCEVLPTYPREGKETCEEVLPPIYPREGASKDTHPAFVENIQNDSSSLPISFRCGNTHENLDRAIVDDGGLVDPSMEFFEWLFLQMWPNVNKMAQGIIKESVEPQFDKEVKKYGMAGRALKGIYFSHFDLGDHPPRIENVRAYRQTAHEHHGIEIDCVVRLNIHPNINLVIMGYDVGISRLKFEGHISCILKPLMHRKPVIGCVQAFLLQRPELDFDLSGHIQGINGGIVHRVMKNVILENISKKLALPNRVTVSLVKEWEIEQDLAELENPRPEYILRIRARSATNLPNADFQLGHVLGMSSKRSGSDPYCSVRVGAQVFRSVTLKNTCDPVWPSEGATCDFGIYNRRQEVEFDVYDDDFGLGKNDHLVGALMSVSQLLEDDLHVLAVYPAGSFKGSPCSSPRSTTPKNGGNGGSPKTGVCDDLKVGGSESLSQSTNLQSPKKAKRWNVLAKVKGLMGSKKEKLVEESALEIGVTKFDLVPCTELALKKIRSLGGPSEAMLAVTIYGLAALGGKKSVEETQNFLIRTTLRKQGQKGEEQRTTKRGKIRENCPVPHNVDRNVMKMIQNMKSLHPDFSTSKIADIIEIDENIVTKVLATKKVMPLAFNELYYFFLGNCMQDIVVIELLGSSPKGAKAKDPKPAIASLEVLVKDVAEAADHVISQGYILTENDAKTEELPQNYELLLKFQVWALEETLVKDDITK